MLYCRDTTDVGLEADGSILRPAGLSPFPTLHALCPRPARALGSLFWAVGGAVRVGGRAHQWASKTVPRTLPRDIDLCKKSLDYWDFLRTAGLNRKQVSMNMKSLRTALLGVAIAAATLTSVEPASALGGCGYNRHRNGWGRCVWGGQNEDWCLRTTGIAPPTWAVECGAASGDSFNEVRALKEQPNPATLATETAGVHAHASTSPRRRRGAFSFA
jgi:hypothetical protein